MVYIPSWHRNAIEMIGVHETPGPQTTAEIAGMLEYLNAPWVDDETPWCGVFVAYCCKRAGVAIPSNWAWAKAWSTWGSPRPKDALGPGTILVFQRPGGGGHVGFYEGEDAGRYYVLGGNQSDQVKRSWLEKSRLIAARWPAGVQFTGHPIYLDSAGQPVSGNEQ